MNVDHEKQTALSSDSLGDSVDSGIRGSNAERVTPGPLSAGDASPETICRAAKCNFESG